jgi:hypothetical protein
MNPLRTPPTTNKSKPDPQAGNVIVFILMAVVLIGIVTAAIRSGGGESANIDSEQLAIRASEIRQYGSELERAVSFLIQKGVSEYDIRFAHANAASSYGNPATTPENQVFSRSGGAAEYRIPPLGIQTVQTNWQFYGNSALPQVGSARPELIAVLPHVTPAFCTALNIGAGYAAGTIPVDPAPGCIHAGSTYYFRNADGTANTADDYSANNIIPRGSAPNEFVVPAIQGCVRCATDNSLHFFHVLSAR